MSLRKISGGTVLFSAVLFSFVPLLPAEAQDVNVLGNLTMTGSTVSQGNILKDGVPFIHNFGSANTFLGLSAGNLTLTGVSNTGGGASALASNTAGHFKTATSARALT